MITSPAYVVIKAATEFKDKPNRINEKWQTDFTYFKIKGWLQDQGLGLGHRIIRKRRAK